MYEGLTDEGGTVGDNAAFPPMGMARDLAKIGRDGASFHIPYLTVNDAYNQRVIIVNRGVDTMYTFGNFQTVGEGMAEAGPMATGPLPTGQTVLRSNVIVNIIGGGECGVGNSLGRDRPEQHQRRDSAATPDGRHSRYGLSGLVGE